MFIHNLHEDTKNYLKTLLVEEEGSSAKKDSKKSKAKKDEKQAPTETSTSSSSAPVSSAPVVDSAVVVNPAKTALNPEEQKIKEAQQKAAEEKERQQRNIQPDSGRDTSETQGYKENVRQTSGGPVRKVAEGPTESGLPNYVGAYGFGPSGRGRGAPAPTGEPEDRTGISYTTKQTGSNYLYNFPVLFGKSMDKIVKTNTQTGEVSPDIILEPYKDLQRIKLLKAVSPSILQKVMAVKNMESSSLGQAVIGQSQGSKLTSLTGKAARGQPQRDELMLAGVLPNDPKLIAAYNDETIEAIYKTASSSTKSDGDDFMKKVKSYTGKLSGLGGLDPLFGEELAAKLLGGEWIEKAMQNIAPAQERGVISSMGNRSSIGM